MVKPDADLLAWIRRQMAFDETKIRGAMYTARQMGAPTAPSDMVEMLAQLEADRARLDTIDDLGLRELGLLYADRPGYLQEWRP